MRTRLWTWLIIAAASTIVVITLVTTHRMAQKLAQEEREKIELWAKATRQIALPPPQQENFSFVLEVIQSNVTIPVILTDEEETPLSFRNIPEEMLNDTAKIMRLVNKYRADHAPIVVKLPSGGENIIFYGSSNTLIRLRYYPYVQLALIMLITFLAFMIYKRSREAQQNRVWVGLAKETAHQLGTPISSLMGWTQLLEGDDALPDLYETLVLDVDRLKRVSDRFSKIGAIPQLEDNDLVETVRQSVTYMQSRISRHISLAFIEPPINIRTPHNSVLIQWVIENLIRNAVDAMSSHGSITVHMAFSHKHALIDVSDTGKGIPRKKRRAVFQPGYSTKTRGWGLGLSLARRIVQTYHHGRIFVLRSELNRGTTFSIELNVNPESTNQEWDCSSKRV